MPGQFDVSAGPSELGDAQVKGAFLRGYCAALKRLDMYSVVIERSSTRLRQALEMPPPPSVWIDYALVEEILRIIEAERGSIGVRRLGHAAVTAGVAPLMQICVQGLLRLFGTSPATVFTHMNRAAGQTTRGVEYSYVATSEFSGTVTVAFPRRRDVELAVWQSSAGGLEIAFEVCGVVGHVQDATVVSNGLGNSAEFRVSWRRRV